MNTIWYETIDSTNTEALRRLDGIPSGTVLAARSQTAGRGQRGNTWFTEPGKNLTFSVVLKDLGLKASDSIRLNALTSVAVASLLEHYGVHPVIKWPNDIYVSGRKICGMLIENTLDGAMLGASVVGIGININQREFPQLANATSLALCTGKDEALEEVLAVFLEIFEGMLSRLDSPELWERYASRLYRLGKTARYYDILRKEEFEGVIQGVEPDGRLCILDAGGERRHYRFKEVSYIL
ncbi:MAG: biotin--[acetyl-CoA-carboxylase] ligase [Bacteroidales bacterium]|nr:biotin--[acetyl-CoA-carboxylase] ligase [Bacteroidales bacterium]